MNILERIISNKIKEVAAARQLRTIPVLEAMENFGRPTYSLKKFLLDENRTGIIAEFKRRSPSKGVINDAVSIEEVTGAYASNLASGISVLTDKEFFGGNLEDLLMARKNQLPLLRKDFIIDEYQVIEAKAFGADVILLIAACLDKSRINDLANLARSLGLEIVFEIHNEKELHKIPANADIVGINNRDLTSFSQDIQTSFDLVNKIPASSIAVSESGISNIETIVSLRKAGFKGFLIGENFMKHASPAVAFADFVKQLKAKK
ncbi:MAG TPA: indole-3-glycerol phosphate synthase TrpC [Flavisolibacter sp.]